MKWESGRQNSGYEKLLIIASALLVPFDIYILRFKEGSFIGWHNDPVEGYKHYRLNIFLKRAKRGGVFISERESIISSRFFQLFRPDINQHAVTRIESGTRYVLSIGWLLKQ